MTRFIIICNYVSKIIEPIASRCAKFRFKPIDEATARAHLLSICEKESLECGEETLSQLSKVSRGDMRSAITTLQSARRLFGKRISAQNILDVSQFVPDSDIQKLFDAMMQPSYEKLQKVVQDLVYEGYSALQVFF